MRRFRGKHTDPALSGVGWARVSLRLLAIGLLLIATGCPRAATPPRPEPVAKAPPPPPAAPAPDAGSPTPESSELDLPPSPSDPFAAMYSKRLDFKGGDPVVPVRLMEGATEVTFIPRGRMRMRVSGPIEKTLEAPAYSAWTVRLTQGEPAQIGYRIQLGEFRLADKAGLAAEQKAWEERGFKVRVHTLGSVYGIAGKVIDNRRYLLLMEEVLSPEKTQEAQARLLREYGARTSLFEELEKKPTGILEVLDAGKASVALGQNRIVAELLDGVGIGVKHVEYGVGYPFHGFQDRAYRGALELTVDRNGKLAVVNLIPLEELLKGLVPSEIFANAPMEALKAQAVTARGEVLAKIGLKHLADPYLLCAEQHCAVYRGLSGETGATNVAVDGTRGLALFSQDGHLVDSVYSAVCGGHTEDNDVVWGGPPDPNLRGKPDILPGNPILASPDNLAAFLATPQAAACRLSNFAVPGKFRWEKRFTAEQLDALTAPLHLGKVQAITVDERGVSGRARLLTLSGDAGATQIRGELNIRRLFGMLNSAMFLVTPLRGPNGAPTGWLFQGGGWGHGVGMCQTGAAGRAQAGQRYPEILRHYFNGAEVAPIY